MKRYRWRQLGICPFTCPVCQDVTLHEHYQVIIEVKRPLRKSIETPYSPMIRCPECGHMVLVERGFGDGFEPCEAEQPYDALARFFGRDHREVAHADAYRNARVNLMTNEARWRLILNAFAHASYEQFVPPRGKATHVPLVRRTLLVIGVMFLISMGWTAGLLLLVAVLPEPTPDVTFRVYQWGLPVLCVAYLACSIQAGLRSWSDDAATKKATPRVHRSLACMLVGLEADGSTLRDAKKVAAENKWVTAAVDPEKVLGIIATEAARQTKAAAPAETARMTSEATNR